jgi:MFS family permease
MVCILRSGMDRRVDGPAHSFQLLLPVQINEALGATLTTAENGWREGVLDFGIISAASAICAIVGLPLMGALSDRTTGRFGRRRPWVLIGAVVFALALAMLGNQRTTTGIAVCGGAWRCSDIALSRQLSPP